MRFVVLGSGSGGNALVVESAGTRILVDCGLTLRDLEGRLGAAGVDPATIAAVLVTHEHGDHAGGVGAFARRYGAPVWTTHGTARGARFGRVPSLNLLSPFESALRIGDIVAEPYALCHDAAEPAHFVISHSGRRLGLLTDSGTVTPACREALGGCDALFIETNHDPLMLQQGPYPPMLRARVGGAYGHLSNRQAAEYLRRTDVARLRYVVAGHLSERNNTPGHAREALLGAVPSLEDRFAIAGPDRPTVWFDLAG